MAVVPRPIRLALIVALVTAGLPAGAPATPATAHARAAASTSEETDHYSFEFAFPDSAARIAGLRAHLEAERAAARRELIASVRRERQALAADDVHFRPFDYTKVWQTVAELPEWLSLSAVVSTYEGGAHPNHFFDALLWDKAAGVRRRPIDLFAAPALRQAIRPAFCAEIDRQRREKRGGERLGEPGDWLNACLDPTREAVLILGSSNRRRFDRIGLLVAPYGAGPYAEGDYEVTLPVTPAVLAAVRPRFRSAFALGR